MDWNAPVPIDLGEAPNIDLRFKALFSHLDFRIYLTPTIYVEIGAGSISGFRIVRYMPWGFTGCAGVIGRFCEFAQCTAFAGGEHPNHRPVNVEFPEGPLGAESIKAFGAAEFRPVTIGDNVVVSKDANILAGAALGTGAVVGAGAVVTRDVEPFAIVGGVPARKIKDRFDPGQKAVLQSVRWWDFHPAYMAENMARLQELALTPGPHRYRPERPRLALLINAEGQLSAVGFTRDGETRPNDELPRSMADYIRHATGEGPFFWRADPWVD